MNINVFSIIVLAEFIIAFMLSLVIALNSERKSAKLLSTAVLLLLVSMAIGVFEREGPQESWIEVQQSLASSGIDLTNEQFSLLGIFLVFYSSDIINMIAGALLIGAFLIMFKDNLPIEIDSIELKKKQESYYWK
ncbi:hypothetical protein COT72_02400 [archaeon CG10_big_fil_rev_8_21_14_0_10_43_11]|nr:MAG: hypothetical protein COT72_02400 [archaeon CG10_big_fil_rev_8_21_14_0_10_43_11]